MSTNLIVFDTHYNEIATDWHEWAHFIRHVSFNAIAWC
jgi:hypothetical protein